MNKFLKLALRGAALAGVLLSSSAASAETGVVSFWYYAKGYGYIRPDNGGKDVLVLSARIIDGTPLAAGSRVDFTIVFAPKGTEARNVRTIW